MPTETRCFTPIRGKRIRVTRLDSCGNPPAPDDECGVVSTDGFVSVSLSSEVEAGTEIITRKADGSLCVNERTADSFKRFTVEIQFCDVDPGLYELVTNANPYNDYDDQVAGITIGEGTIESAFALELWTGLTGQACAPGVEEASGYLLLPFVNSGVLGDLEINGEAAIEFSLTGAFTKGGNAWGVGPYNVLSDGGTAAPLPTPLDPLDHLLLTETGIAPPPAACGCQPYTPDTPPAPAGGGAWQANHAYALNDTVTISGDTLEATTAGTSGSTAPTPPATVGDTVTDGTVTWTRTA